MYICGVGDIHGNIDEMYSKVKAFESKLNLTFSYVLQVGDFGIWTKDSIVDRATLKHEGVGDFPDWYEKNKVVPIPTIFINGNHEDFIFLGQRKDSEIIPGLFYLKSGTKFNIGRLKPFYVGGVGGCYGYSSYKKPSKIAKPSHYRLEQIENIISKGLIDILLTHDAPYGVRLSNYRGSYTTESIGLDAIVEAVSPKLWLFGHHHQAYYNVRNNTTIIGLSILGTVGDMVALEIVNTMDVKVVEINCIK